MSKGKRIRWVGRPAGENMTKLSTMPMVRALLVMGLAGVVGCGVAVADPTPAEAEFFEAKVRPLLVARCFGCHGAEAVEKGKLKAGLRLDSREAMEKGGESGAALVPGDPGKSLLMEAVGYGNEDLAMPPDGKLAEGEIAVLREWVRMGAPWVGGGVGKVESGRGGEPYDWERFRREHWAFRKVVRPEVPETAGDGWSRGEIDRFVYAGLRAAGLEPNGAAEKGQLLRRAWLDLVGLPPSVEKVEAFLADDDPGAFARVVDELLGSVQYGERWGRHWLDVARYSDGFGGFGDDGPLVHAWRYRDWVVAALNADMRYDEFVERQIAGDLTGGAVGATGTGFFVVGPNFRPDGGDAEAVAKAEAETLSDRVDTFSRAFLGLTVACARCHDHKFDPVTAKDYYALAGVFRNTRSREYEAAGPEVIAAYRAGQEAIAAVDRRVAVFMEDAANRHGKPVKEAESVLTDDEKRVLGELRAERERVVAGAAAAPPVVHGLEDSGDADMAVALRGDLRKPGDVVPRRFLEIVSGGGGEAWKTGSGRKELARAVVDPGNPLTARVMVNRVWAWHFGEGLVRTPSNFGVLGEKPTHPELLDWLAAEFVADGWSLKRLHRRILLSATWQLSSRYDEGKFARDGENRWLWRMHPRKLEGEAWRDSLLAVSGELDGTVGGPPEDDVLASRRRTMYGRISRTGDVFASDAFLRLFDFPAAVATAEQRVTSTVPQQYLFMLNSPFMAARAAALGDWMSKRPGGVVDKVGAAYWRLYGREVSAAERALAGEWLGSEPVAAQWAGYAQVLLSAHELIQIP